VCYNTVTEEFMKVKKAQIMTKGRVMVITLSNNSLGAGNKQEAELESTE
jgi:hypothetical protein